MFRFDPYDPAIDADPFPAYQTLRDEYPCFWSEEAQIWILSRYDDISAALKDWQTYSSSHGNLITELPGRAGSTLGTTDPPRHDRLRALVQHAFTRRNLMALDVPIRAVAHDAAAELRGQSQFDFIAQFSSKFTMRVIFAVLGLPLGNEAAARQAAVTLVQCDPVTRAKGPAQLAAFKWMLDYAGSVIAERRAAPQNDLISHLAQAEIDGDRLSDNEVLMTTGTLISAGIESLGGFMAMFGLNLAEHADARARVVADPTLLGEAIEESLRYNTSAQRFRRVLMRDVEMHGQVMRQGQYVSMTYGAGNRDERKFPDPDRYDIDRKPRGHLGFGGGVHQCLGSEIARMATRIAFEEFHQVVPAYRRTAAPLPWLPSTTFRSPMALQMAAAA